MGRKERMPEAADSQADHHTPVAAVCTSFSFTSQYSYELDGLHARKADVSFCMLV